MIMGFGYGVLAWEGVGINTCVSPSESELSSVSSSLSNLSFTSSINMPGLTSTSSSESTPPTTPGIHAEEFIENEYTKLILCFDGTGNTFSGTNADTNVVKILRKLDRNSNKQFHYYQSTSIPSTV